MAGPSPWAPGSRTQSHRTAGGHSCHLPRRLRVIWRRKLVSGGREWGDGPRHHGFSTWKQLHLKSSVTSCSSESGLGVCPLHPKPTSAIASPTQSVRQNQGLTCPRMLAQAQPDSNTHSFKVPGLGLEAHLSSAARSHPKLQLLLSFPSR